MMWERREEAVVEGEDGKKEERGRRKKDGKVSKKDLGERL